MGRIVIDTMSFFVTFRCNLKCAHCCTRAPYEKSPVDFPLANLKHSLSRLFDSVGFIRKFSFTGGEPMLQPDLRSLILETLRYKDQMDVFEIVTNGTVMPPQDVIDVLSENAENVYVMIDRYGELSTQADNLLAALSARGVDCHVREYGARDPYGGGWVNLGDLSLKHSPEETEKVFRSCSIVNKKKINTATKREVDSRNAFLIVYCTLCNGELHYCGRAAATTRTLRLPESVKDFVKLTDETLGVTEIQDKIVSMFSENVPISCAYCNGELDGSPRVTPAQQMKGGHE